jgi:GTPase SAR1 family protein
MKKLNMFIHCVFSLVSALTKNRFAQEDDYEEKITDGIDICEWNVPIENEQQPLQYSVWDFAGQTVYYNTHQVCLTHPA